MSDDGMGLQNYYYDRLISISLPELNKNESNSDNFLALSVDGFETISAPFQYDISFLCFDLNLKKEDFLAQQVILKITQTSCAPKIVHGIIEKISETRTSELNPFKQYCMQLVPRLALLKSSLDYRIYQNKSAIEIIKFIFKTCHAGKCDFTRLIRSYEPIDYCVQYSESYFDFLSRLCEQYQLYYYCETRAVQSNTKQTIAYEHVVVFENSGQPKNNDAKSPVSFQSSDYQDRAITAISFSKSNFSKEQNGYSAASDISDFELAQLFKLTDHQIDAFNQDYFIVSSQCHAQDYSQQDYFKSSEDSPLETKFENHLTLLSKTQLPYVVPTTSPKLIAHYETALVTGHKHEEIDTNELGQVKIKFPWDKYIEDEAASSCWVPVSQHLFGATHVTNFIPRIGDEVLLSYEYGNPDQPIITGSLYSAENLPPFNPAETPYKTGIKTKTISSTDPDDANFISFDDDPTDPRIEIQAQKDFMVKANQDYTRQVQSDATLDINQGDFQQTTGGDLTITATNEIRFSCGNSAIVLSQEGIAFEGAGVVLVKSAVPMPALPEGDVVAGIANELTKASEPPAEQSPVTQEDKIVEVIYATKEKKFYALTQSEYQQIAQMEERVNQPRIVLQQLLAQAKSSSSSDADKLAQALQAQREECLNAIKSLTNNQVAQLSEVIHLGAKRTWGYINTSALTTSQYVLDHSEIDFVEAVNAISNALKNKVQEKSFVNMDVTLLDAEVDGAFNQWADCINQSSPQQLFTNQYMEVSSEAKLMRYSMGASVSGGFNAIDKALAYKNEIKGQIDLCQGKLTTKIQLPEEGSYRHFQLDDLHGQCLDLGLFKAEIETVLYGGAGASVQLGGEMSFDLTQGKTITKGMTSAGSVDQFFAGANAGCNLTGSLYWANPENLKPPTDQSKQHAHIQAKGDLNQAIMKKLATIGGGIEVAAGVGTGEKFKIVYEDQRFYIVTAIKAVAGFGFGGRICVEVMVETMKEFILFLYHQIKNHNYNYTGLFMDQAYYAWVSIVTVAGWAGDVIEDYVKNGVNKAKAWLYKLDERHSSVAHIQRQLIDNLNKQPELIAQAPPETKGHWLYYLCQEPMLSKEYWEKDFLRRQDIIVTILHHIQSDNEYQTVCEFMLPIDPDRLDTKPEKQSALIGAAMLWENKASVMYIGAEIRYDLDVLSVGLGKQLNEVAKATYNQAQYRPVAYQFLQTTALMGVWSH